MKSVLRFGDGLRQAEIREDGPSENFYNQNVVAVNRQTDADKDTDLSLSQSLRFIGLRDSAHNGLLLPEVDG